MFFWNINALVHKLKTFTLTSYEQAQYYLTVMLCFSLSTIAQLLPQQAPLDARVLIGSWISGLIVLCCGIAYCYMLNKQGDDKDFMLRMITLLFTGGIRLALFSLLAIIPLSILYGMILSKYVSPEAMQQHALFASAIGSIFGIIWSVFLYWYVGQQFKKIAEHTKVVNHYN